MLHHFLVENLIKECPSIFHDLLVTKRTTMFTWFRNITYLLTQIEMWKLQFHRQGSKIARNQLLPHTHTHVITVLKFVLFSWQQQKTGSLPSTFVQIINPGRLRKGSNTKKLSVSKAVQWMTILARHIYNSHYRNFYLLVLFNWQVTLPKTPLP